METIIKCFLGVNGQPAEQKTYVNIVGTLLVDDNDLGNFFGVRIPCSLTVTRNVVGACLNTSQGIRVTVTIDGEDVSDSLVGSITINHNLNYISTFSFSLGDPKYSPLIDFLHIAVNKVVIITAYINGQSIKMFTGLIDETRTTYDGGYRLQINGRDYGKKLLDKTMTLISVQDSASGSNRGSIVKYLAGQAGITNVNVPAGDAVTIDHSFQDQSLWDMIQKECAIEGWYVRHDENAIMKVKTRTIKTNETSYPVADWEYGEDKFIQLGLETSDKGIINKVIILGAIFEEEVITITPADTTITPPKVDVLESEYTEDTVTISKSFSQGQVVDGVIYEDANFKVIAKYVGSDTQPGLPFNPYQNYRFSFGILNSDLEIMNLEFTISGGAFIYRLGGYYCEIHRHTSTIVGPPMTSQEVAFTITVTIKTKEEIAGGDTWIDDNLPAEVAADMVVSTITYTQVKASVEDAASIALYGERKPNNEGTLEFPLAETETQCKRIGENIILDSHRFIKQPDLEVAFNPKLIVGETVELTDKKIGYDEDRYFIEEVIHTLDIDNEGKIKARTRIGCVYYA